MQSHNVQEYANSVVAYALAFYAMVGAHGGEVMGFLGFVLLVAKLVQELPKTWKIITGKKIDG